MQGCVPSERIIHESYDVRNASPQPSNSAAAAAAAAAAASLHLFVATDLPACYTYSSPQAEVPLVWEEEGEGDLKGGVTAKGADSRAQVRGPWVGGSCPACLGGGKWLQGLGKC